MTLSRIVSIFFGVGLLRPAPGTWGSAAALGVGLIIHRIGHFPLLAVATVLVTLAGFWACRSGTCWQTGRRPVRDRD